MFTALWWPSQLSATTPSHYTCVTSRGVKTAIQRQFKYTKVLTLLAMNKLKQ